MTLGASAGAEVVIEYNDDCRLLSLKFVNSSHIGTGQPNCEPIDPMSTSAAQQGASKKSCST
jgi:hypothetical protein